MVRHILFTTAILCVLLLSNQSTFAQVNRGGVLGGRGATGFNPMTMQQRQLDYIKNTLGVTDQEWQVLQPKIQLLINQQMSATMAARAGRRNRGGAAARAGNTSAVALALADLQRTLSNASASPQLIDQQLATLRAARQKAAADLAAARKSVKDLLTIRQEAVLVTMGYLE